MNDMNGLPAQAGALLPGGLLAPSLAEGAQLVLLSGYTAGEPAGPVRVVLDQRGARVVLVLASYETVAWELDVRPGTELVAVVASAYRAVAVTGHGAAPAYRLALPCAPTPDSAAYQDLMQILQTRLGRSRPDTFRGYVRLPEQVAIASCGSAAGASAQPQPRVQQKVHAQYDARHYMLRGRRQSGRVDQGQQVMLDESIRIALLACAHA
ncbi:hypothetical protein ASE26_11785 [Duganella sp. Root198D2]|nr:hypothetical protein ASD07_18950 [Duganella sp. Root336D2]KRB83158.1 hypothetical protein ASE26_11785 [Duganella sp. Root198D2]